jgi:hypothetical protein
MELQTRTVVLEFGPFEIRTDGTQWTLTRLFGSTQRFLVQGKARIKISNTENRKLLKKLSKEILESEWPKNNEFDKYQFLYLANWAI